MHNLGWLFYQPKIGDIAYMKNRNCFYYFTGISWEIMTTGSSSQVNTDENTDIQHTSNIEVIISNPFQLGMLIKSKAELSNPSWLKSDATAKDGTIYTGIYDKLVDVNINGDSGILTINNITYDTKEKDGFVLLTSND